MHRMLDQLVTEMVDKGIDFAHAQQEFEKRFIARVIETHAGNLSKAADCLGVHRNTLARKMKELKLKTR